MVVISEIIRFPRPLHPASATSPDSEEEADGNHDSKAVVNKLIPDSTEKDTPKAC